MRTTSTLAVLAAHIAAIVAAKHGDTHLRGLEHRHLHHKGRSASAIEAGHGYQVEVPAVEKRTGQCQFPEDAGLVPVSGLSNGGWAMSPDECCEPGGYCPYACPPGQISMQWDPEATSYTYPQSMHGGLFCDKNGKIKKPFPDRPYCVDGTGNVGCRNKAPGNVAICQTVLPGNEAMLIPTDVQDSATLAIPGPEYWAGTAAHFYVNPPGVSPEEGCIWGSADKPHGNWSPYVLGGNTVESGETFIKLGWNPIYLEPATPFRDEKPTFSIEIVCDGDGCNGLPCAIDPSQHGVNELVGSRSVGAGGAASCVVTVPKGGSARYVVSECGSKGSGSNDHETEGDKSEDSPKKHSSPPPPPSSRSPSSPPPTSTTQSSTASSTSSSKVENTPTSTSSPSSSSSTSSTSISTSMSSPSSTPTTTLSESSSSETSMSTTSSSSTSMSTSESSESSETSKTSETSSYTALHTTFAPVYIKAHVPRPLKHSYKPHVFADNATATATPGSGSIVGSASLTASASASQGSDTAISSPPAIQPQNSNDAGSTHSTAAALGLTALAAFAVAAL
ncbi:MAG: hypothetical protein Q9171_000602 [Xanthocarpia ochracea]